VTHDQIEAMTMADKIVVMHDGLVEQIGAPLALYDRPDNLFVRRLHRLARDEFPVGEDPQQRQPASKAQACACRWSGRPPRTAARRLRGAAGELHHRR